ncbi:hypothetical protein PN36_32035 [Candidatus Thiomargarita nelsonii]|uniref:Teneurin-like YD-shell domain-containing protein n=1 Tax=Candidatus Thiomargarita nelsonii TaxID=1003181 RepID=A0A4E0RBS0_9GAMM|nr:hypothetical protein PN36_32035 [Candidatus Thiomargarita nelsonii]
MVLDYGYEYSPTSNIVAKATEHGEYSYFYDELYRLSGAVSPVLDDESFVYDLLGNRLNGGATFDGNNALLSVDEAVFEYDANGNLVRKSVGAEVTVFVFDVGDRLIRVEDGSGGVVAEYFYDPFGRRLFKEVEGVRTYFVYSNEGLVGEFDESGIELKGYGYRPNSVWTTNPLFLKVGGEYFWFLNDHLGTPQKIVDSQGNVVWEGVYESFGKARVLVSVVESNLRFAGQYFDVESGLHYNYFRFYDPEVGRYFRVDPVWAVNLYTYVSGQPIRLVDPLGLAESQVLVESIGRSEIHNNPTVSQLVNIINSLPNSSIIYFRLTGHGNQNSFDLNPMESINSAMKVNGQHIINITGSKNDEGYIDFYKAGKLDELLKEKLHHNAHIEFAACNTAKGDDNLAKRLSKLLPGVIVTGGSTFLRGYLNGFPFIPFDGSNGMFGKKRSYITIDNKTYDWEFWSWFQ